MNWEEIAKKEQIKSQELGETLKQVKELLEEERKESTNSFMELQKIKEKIEKRAEASENNLQRLITAVKQDKAKSMELEKKKEIDYENKLKISEERIKFLEEQLKKEGNTNQDILKIQNQMEDLKLSYEEKISSLNTELSIYKNKLQISEDNGRDLNEQLQELLKANELLRNSSSGESGGDIEKYKKEAQLNKDKCEKLQTALKNLQEKTKKMVELVGKERQEQNQIMQRNSQNNTGGNNNEKILELEKTISSLKQQLQEANEKLQNTSSSTTSPPPISDNFTPMDAPPPPPPPPIFEIKPIRIVIAKNEGQEIKPLERKSKFTVIKPQIDFVQELKSGIKLKKTSHDPNVKTITPINSNIGGNEGMGRTRTMTNDNNPMGMISSMAVKLAKERQTRILEGNTKLGPVRSKRLDNLLDRI